MTEKLYENNCDVFNTFNSSLTSITKASDNSYKITLDKTNFFPEAGGQSCDLGIIEINDLKLQVFDVQEENANIMHYCKFEGKQDLLKVIQEGQQVAGTIDSRRRLGFMQHHSAEHLVSGLIHKKFGYNNVGFHLSDNICTMDYDGPISPEDLALIEKQANNAIYEDVAIKCYYPTASDLAKLDYRSKKEIDGDLRIVEITGYDICACCAPHLKSTGQIGLIKITSYQSCKGGCRLNLLAGYKAYEYVTSLENIVKENCSLLSSSPDMLNDNIKSLLESKEELRIKLINESREKLFRCIESLRVKENENIYLITENVDNKIMREGVNLLVENHPDKFCLIISKNNNSFIIGSQNKDCNELAKNLRENKLAKCGGSPEMIQGSTNNIDEFINLFIFC